MRRPSLRALRRFKLTRRLGLRARITLAFAIGALLLSALLSGTTWALTRENLLNQREDSAKVLVFQNARTVQARVSDDTDQQALLSSLSTRRGAQPILYFDDQYVPLSPEFGQDALPPALRSVVIEQGEPASMRYDLRGEMRARGRRAHPVGQRGLLRDHLPRRAREHPRRARRVLGGSLARHHPGRRGARLVGRPSRPPPAGQRERRGPRARPRPTRHPPRAERGPRSATRSPPRSTRWPKPCSPASSRTPASRPTSATSSGRPS